MQAKQELEYIILVVNDYLNALPTSSRVAVGERAQQCISTIEQVLQSVDVPKLPEGSENVVGP